MGRRVLEDPDLFVRVSGLPALVDDPGLELGDLRLGGGRGRAAGGAAGGGATLAVLASSLPTAALLLGAGAAGLVGPGDAGVELEPELAADPDEEDADEEEGEEEDGAPEPGLEPGVLVVGAAAGLGVVDDVGQDGEVRVRGRVHPGLAPERRLQAVPRPPVLVDRTRSHLRTRTKQSVS